MTVRVLTIDEAAGILRLHPDTVVKLITVGRIKAARTGLYSGKWRISETALEEYLAGGGTESEAEVRLNTHQTEQVSSTSVDSARWGSA